MLYELVQKKRYNVPVIFTFLIYFLAKDMIKLSGMSIKDDKNPDGDIEVT